MEDFFLTKSVYPISRKKFSDSLFRWFDIASRVVSNQDPVSGSGHIN